MSVPLRGARCRCTVCGLTFSGESTFDMHRVGRFAEAERQTRRCLSTGEMKALGMVLADDGCWRSPGSSTEIRVPPGLRQPIPAPTAVQGAIFP